MCTSFLLCAAHHHLRLHTASIYRASFPFPPALPSLNNKQGLISLTHSLTFSLSHTLFSNVLHSSTHRYTKTMATRRGPYVVSPRSGRLHWVTKKLRKQRVQTVQSITPKPNTLLLAALTIYPSYHHKDPWRSKPPNVTPIISKKKKGTRKRLQNGIVQYVIW